MTTDRRAPLSRASVLAAAVQLADSEGIEAVSMRRLAQRLGVVPMALYKHVADKDDLLTGMVDTLVAAYAPAPPRADWRDGVRTRILSARHELVAHPWARGVLESRTTRTPTVLGYLDSLAGLFLNGGFSADLTPHVMHTLGHRIWGFSPEAFEEPAPRPAPAGAQPAASGLPPAELLAQLQATYPHIAAITLDAVDGDLSRVGAGCDEQFEFEFALDLLLDAFDRLRQAGWSSPRRR